MKVGIKGTKIVMSHTPTQDVPGAFFLIYKYKDKINDKTIDVKKGQKHYDLPDGIVKKDIEALYLRVL
jgi:hypothetical protein